jgi:D-alanine-D-alanine ligase
VIFGGRSGEHEVSLMSARSVMEALNQEKYDIVEIGIDHDGHWYSGQRTLEAFENGDLSELARVALLGQPDGGSLFAWGLGKALEMLAALDVVFPVLHGTFGEDGTMQGLLELADVPYVGAGVLASSVAMDKGLFKTLMQAHGLPVLPALVLGSDRLRADPQAAVEMAGAIGEFPLFTKPANLGSSVGVSKCRNESDLLEGLMEAAVYDRRVVIEKGIDAREIEVSVLGNEFPKASIAGEIVPSREFYTYEAKYVDDASELLIPAPVDEALMADIQRIAVEAYTAIDGAGMARVDFLLERETGELYLNEINTIPGFTKISMYPKLWQAEGVSYPDLCDELIDLAWQRYGQKEGLVRQFGSVS